MSVTRVDRFLLELEASDAFPPLSDAKLTQLGSPDSVLVVEDSAEIVAVGVTFGHAHADGTRHWAIETAVASELRFPAFEDRVLNLALKLGPAGEAVSVWSHRASLDAALDRAGFISQRELKFLTVALPLPGDDVGIELRSFRPGDADALLTVNRAAFHEHREAASLDRRELARLMDEPWFSAENLLVHEKDAVVEAFCWTRVHPNGDGEIYRIAVAPKAQGRGLGKALVRSGFRHLSSRTEVQRGTLWVDAGNENAMSLYRSLGMKDEASNREFVRP